MDEYEDVFSKLSGWNYKQPTYFKAVCVKPPENISIIVKEEEDFKAKAEKLGMKVVGPITEDKYPMTVRYL